MQRARKIERFLSQPFFVAEQFTGTPGAYVPVEETVRSFKEIIEGKHDDMPERAFLLKGTIDDVVEAAKGSRRRERPRGCRRGGGGARRGGPAEDADAGSEGDDGEE